MWEWHIDYIAYTCAFVKLNVVPILIPQTNANKCDRWWGDVYNIQVLCQVLLTYTHRYTV